MCPVKFWVVGLEPVCAEDDVVGADGCDIEFGAFLVVLFIGGVDADGLDGRVCYRTGFIHGAVDISYGKG